MEANELQLTQEVQKLDPHKLKGPIQTQQSYLRKSWSNLSCGHQCPLKMLISNIRLLKKIVNRICLYSPVSCCFKASDEGSIFTDSCTSFGVHSCRFSDGCVRDAHQYDLLNMKFHGNACPY